MIDTIKRFLTNPAELDACFKAGFDCGLNGASTDNCSIAYFSSRERTTKWEQGKKAGEQAKKLKS